MLLPASVLPVDTYTTREYLAYTNDCRRLLLVVLLSYHPGAHQLELSCS
jgi:hypothetical protein